VDVRRYRGLPCLAQQVGHNKGIVVYLVCLRNEELWAKIVSISLKWAFVAKREKLVPMLGFFLPSSPFSSKVLWGPCPP
jgi:hypothetical protein